MGRWTLLAMARSGDVVVTQFGGATYLEARGAREIAPAEADRAICQADLSVIGETLPSRRELDRRVTQKAWSWLPKGTGNTG